MKIDPVAMSINVKTDDTALDGKSIVLEIALLHKTEASSGKLIVSINFKDYQ